MAPLHPQGRRKADKRAVDMSGPSEPSGPSWTRPPPEECEAQLTYFLVPEGADPATHRLMLRMYSHVETQLIVEFALIHQTLDRGKWRNVAAVDSCHDVDVHLHQYARSTDARAGEVEVLTRIGNMSDVQRGYDLAYDRVSVEWADNLRRWHNA